jgi:GNAT superfamily N-acetyltransferase
LPSDSGSILEIINDAALVYKGVIPSDRWKEPYMSERELNEEIRSGVIFYGWMENKILVGVMGIQEVEDVTLIRHSYVAKARQRSGIGRKLLRRLIDKAETDIVLVGTWASASWAIRFYEKHGFKMVTPKEKDMLLKKYWNIPARQIETSVVLRLNAVRNNYAVKTQG